MTVAPGEQVVVTITAANYGGFGSVKETLPPGFGYVSSTYDFVAESVVNGQTVLQFTFLGAVASIYLHRYRPRHGDGDDGV